MNPGEMKERVTIQQAAAAAANAWGESADTWADVATVWARITKLSSREVLQGKQVESQASYRVTIRERSDVTTVNRLKWGSTYLYIESVMEDTPGSFLDLMCGVRG
jgi:SPP1 family predicted phage head-tail adaptor